MGLGVQGDNWQVCVVEQRINWNCNCSKGLFGYSPYEVENGKLTRT